MSLNNIFAEKLLYDRFSTQPREVYSYEEEDSPLLTSTPSSVQTTNATHPTAVATSFSNTQSHLVCPTETAEYVIPPPLTLGAGVTFKQAADLAEIEKPSIPTKRLSDPSNTDKASTSFQQGRDPLLLETAATGSIHLHVCRKKPGETSKTTASSGMNGPDSAVVLDLDEYEEANNAQRKPLKGAAISRYMPSVAVTLFLLGMGTLLLLLAPSARWIYLELWRWCYFVAGLAPVWWISGLIVHCLLGALEGQLFTVEQAFYFLFAMQRPATTLLRMLLCICLFILTFAASGTRPDDVQVAYVLVLKTLVCLALFAAGNVVKTLLAKLLASHVHNKAHFNKMQDALQKEYFLHALSQPRPQGNSDAAALSMPSSHQRQALEAQMQEKGAQSRDTHGRSFSEACQSTLHTLRHSAGNKPGSMAALNSTLSSELQTPRNDLPKAPKGLPPLEAEGRGWARRVAQLERHMRENKLRQHSTFVDELGRAQSEWDEVRSSKEAKRLAFDVWWNVRADLSRNYIVFEDLLSFLPADKALAALKVLDGNGDGRVSPSEMWTAVLNIYKERKNLAATLSDTRSVVGKMEATFAAITHMILIFFYLTVFQVWLSFSSGVLAFAFVFGDHLRSVYSACLLLFVVHPFDVGDACFIDKDQYAQVVEISLQCTLFQRWDGIRIYVPNAKLSAEPILNITRSAKRWEGFKVLVDISTPAEVFERVERAVTAHFTANPAEYTGEKMVVANGATDPLKFNLCVFWEYSHSGVELGRMSKARHSLYMVISKTLVQANAKYHLPPYEQMQSTMLHHGLRPPGEGLPFMPAQLSKAALKL